jgi:hypothetical protein
MNAGGLGLDGTEQIKWADALDAVWSNACVEKGLQMARECRHPDAQWLASLFPAGVPVTRERMALVMVEQGEDARAMYLAWRLSVASTGVLRRAAELGYAPAQASLSEECEVEECFMWAERAAAQGDRNGLFQLARRFRLEYGCAKNEGTVNELYRQAAELGHLYAQWFYGGSAFGEYAWERFDWWGRAALRGCSVTFFCSSVLRLLRKFAKGDLGRILHTVAPVMRNNMNDAERRVLGSLFLTDEMEKFHRLIQLHDEMLGRAKRAIACWSVVARRRGVVKDIRVMISKRMWEEAWQWGEKKGRERAKRNV